MRYKFIVVLGLIGAVGIAVGQDINRAGEWQKKRAEQSQAQLEAETKNNGTFAPKGLDAAVIDEKGDPISRKRKSLASPTEVTSATDDSAVANASEPRPSTNLSVRDQFSAANAAVVADVKDEPKPFLVGGIFLVVVALFLAGLRLLARRIKIPEGALER